MSKKPVDKKTPDSPKDVEATPKADPNDVYIYKSLKEIHNVYSLKVRNTVEFLMDLVSKEHFQAAVDMIPRVSKEIDEYDQWLLDKTHEVDMAMAVEEMPPPTPKEIKVNTVILKPDDESVELPPEPVVIPPPPVDAAIPLDDEDLEEYDEEIGKGQF